MQRNTVLQTVLAIVTGCVFAFASIPSFAQTTAAYDDANTGGYSPQPDHGWMSYNGGTGFDLWTALGSASGGGTYMEGVGVNGRQVDGSYSFALYSGSGSYAVSRQLVNPVTAGTFSILTRFDISGSGPNLVNIRAGNNTSGFGSGELLSFGIVNGSALSYTDSSGFHTLSSGEARGAIWDWTVAFDAAAGTYSLGVSQVGGGYSTSVNGSLEETGTSLDSFGVINSSTGANQNVIFDALDVTVPEPTTLALLGMGIGSIYFLRRRK